MSALLDISAAFAPLRDLPPLKAKEAITPSVLSVDPVALNASGVPMNSGRALTVTAVWACVQLLSQTIATLPLHVYRRHDRGRLAVPDHPVEGLLGWKANALQTAQIFRETLQTRSLTGGNGYAVILRDSRGEPGELWPITNGWFRPDRKGLSLVYDSWTDEFGQRIWSPRDVLHVPDLVTDGYKGLSPIAAHAQGIGLAKAAEEFGARLFLQGVRASGFIKRGDKADDDATARYRAAFDALYAGLGNAHRVVLLEPGDDWISATINPNDAQFLETRRYQAADIARIFNVPPAMIGASSEDSQTYANVEHRMLHFVVFSLLPRLIRWESEINTKLFPDRSLFVKHKVDALLRGDIKSRYMAYAIGRQWGWLSANDVLAKEDENPIDGGDVYLTPSNMTPADALGDAVEQDQGSGKGADESAVHELRAVLSAWDREAA